MPDIIHKLIKKNKVNIFKVHSDYKCKMHEVFLNNESIYIGNFWDFHRGCWGGWSLKVGEFYGPVSLIHRTIATYKIENTKIIEKELRYTENGNWRYVKNAIQ